MAPSPLTIADVQKIAALARLGLTQAELGELAVTLGNILQHFTSLQAIATSNVKPADTVSGLHNVTRLDQVVTEPLCTPAELLAIAPATARGHVQVSAVL